MCDLLQTEADALYLTKYNQDMYDPAFYGMSGLSIALMHCNPAQHCGWQIPAGGKLYDFEWSNHNVDTVYSRTGLTKLH